MGFQTCKTSLRNWTLVVSLNVSKDTLVEDEEGSINETPAPAPSTSLLSTSAGAGPSGLHAFSGFGDVSAISLTNGGQVLAQDIPVVDVNPESYLKPTDHSFSLQIPSVDTVSNVCRKLMKRKPPVLI